jgi:hypothetical protein
MQTVRIGNARRCEVLGTEHATDLVAVKVEKIALCHRPRLGPLNPGRGIAWPLTARAALVAQIRVFEYSPTSLHASLLHAAFLVRRGRQDAGSRMHS